MPAKLPSSLLNVFLLTLLFFCIGGWDMLFTQQYSNKIWVITSWRPRFVPKGLVMTFRCFLY